jgi:hypothetical protein
MTLMFFFAQLKMYLRILQNIIFLWSRVWIKKDACAKRAGGGGSQTIDAKMNIRSAMLAVISHGFKHQK